MNNYERYAGTPERFADVIAAIDCETGIGEELTRQYCQGECHENEKDDVNCTEENLIKCIMVWLSMKTKESP